MEGLTGNDPNGTGQKAQDLFQSHFIEFSKATSELTELYTTSLRNSKELVRQGKLSKYVEALNYLQKMKDHRHAPVFSLMSHLTNTMTTGPNTTIDNKTKPKTFLGTNHGNSQQINFLNGSRNTTDTMNPSIFGTGAKGFQPQTAPLNWFKKIKVKESMKRVYDEDFMDSIAEPPRNVHSTTMEISPPRTISNHNIPASTNPIEVEWTNDIVHRLKRTRICSKIEDE